jgi:hypothetical protein
MATILLIDSPKMLYLINVWGICGTGIGIFAHIDAPEVRNEVILCNFNASVVNGSGVFPNYMGAKA